MTNSRFFHSNRFSILAAINENDNSANGKNVGNGDGKGITIGSGDNSHNDHNDNNGESGDDSDKSGPSGDDDCICHRQEYKAKCCYYNCGKLYFRSKHDPATDHYYHMWCLKCAAKMMKEDSML